MSKYNTFPPNTINLESEPAPTNWDDVPRTNESVDLLKELLAREIDPHTPDEDEGPPTLMVDGIPVCTPGNVSLVSGAEKTRKTFFVGAMAATVTNKSFGPMSSELEDGKTFLWFDTEQAMKHVKKSIRRAENLGAKNIRAFFFREDSPDAIREFIEVGIREIENVGFVMIDGISDLLTAGTNDEADATTTTRLLMKLSSEFNVAICCVLHTAQSTGQARGWIGQEMKRKCESIIELKKDGATTTVSARATRDQEFESFSFTINPDGEGFLELSEDDPGATTTTSDDITFNSFSSETHSKVIRGIFHDEPELTAKGFYQLVGKGFHQLGHNLSDSKRAKFAETYENENWIKHKRGGHGKKSSITANQNHPGVGVLHPPSR